MSLPPFALIDTTLREGEQFAYAHFTREQKIRIATALDAFGIDYLEVTNPAASPGSFADCRALTQLGLRCKILAHIRCNLDDAARALEAGVDGLNIVIGASPYLQAYSHGLDVDAIIERATHVLTEIRRQAPTIALRFSLEDAFRSRLADLLRIYLAVDHLGIVDRLGIADTVGVATPTDVAWLVGLLRRITTRDIEFHGHNDTGCAIANAAAALEAGATHIDVSVLGIGERNGITPLGGLLARLYTRDPAALRQRYALHRLGELEELVAECVGVTIPFNNPITGETAFTHKAGIHTKAVLNQPVSYEAIDPADFGRTRTIAIAHRLTGWHAVQARAAELGLQLDDARIRAVAAHVKALADTRPVTLDDVDALLRAEAERSTALSSSSR